MSGPHSTDLRVIHGERYTEKEWDTALELSLRLQHIATVWRIESNRSMEHVDALAARLGKWMNDVMRLAGSIDQSKTPTIERTDNRVLMRLKIDKRLLCVQCTIYGYVEFGCDTPAMRSNVPAPAQGDQDHQQTMPVEALLSLINTLKTA